MRKTKMNLGTVCEIERYALNDGPGIRTLVFLKGCPLRCKWCSNPETHNYSPELYYYAHRCTFCGKCIDVCPYHAIRADYSRQKVITDRNICKACGKCTKVCLSEARSIIGMEMTVEQVMEEIRKDLPFYLRGGGGITLSGGEVLSQHKFALEILKKCRSEFIDTAIETSGYASWEVVKEVLDYTDHVLIDIKHMDPGRHMELTGVDNRLILDNIKRIDRSKVNYVIRIPLITGINDDETNIKNLSEFINELRNLKEIHLLPYHTGSVK
ncbi:glycyl-radical enzyme activating protein [Thermoanaerobacterium sp. DL9XJH110]|uniref:glycyl-radical enzyme activating protein n=1 Tax=Thermoanaerobacterium sp. DL9XJH110 TaxID=3386643 RepID=UPI003BB80B80